MRGPTRVLPGFDRAAWRGLAVRSVLQDPDWLAAMASKIPGEVHTIVHGGAVGFLGAVVTDPDAYEAFNPYAILFRDPPVFELRDPGARRRTLPGADPAAILPALVLAAPGYLGDPAGTTGDPGALRACLSGVVDWCRERGARTLCCLYTQQATAAITEAVAALGGTSFPLTTRWTLPVWWDTWEGYLAGFGASRRRKVRRELRAAAEAGVRPARIEPSEHAEAIVDGRCAKLRSHGHEPDPDAERERLARLLDAFGGGVTAYGALRGTELVASIVCLERGRTLQVLYSGVTEHGERLPFAHFVASYYAPAEHVGKRELDRIDYGIDHGTAKAFRGCRPEALHGHVVGLDPTAGELLATGARLLREAGTHRPAGTTAAGTTAAGATGPGLVTAGAYPDAWRSLPRLPLLASQRWHRAMARRFDGAPVWLWTSRRGTGAGAGDPPVEAGLSGFVVSSPDAYVYGNAAALLADPASPFAPATVAEALAAAATPPDRLLPHLLLTHPGYSTFPVGAGSSDPAASRHLLERILEWAAAEGLVAVALPYVESGSPLAEAARATGFSGWPLTEDSYLDVPEGGFDGYLAGFGSHRRQRIRAERRRLHARGLRGRPVRTISEPLLDRMAHLRVAQRRRYGLAGDPAAERDRLVEVVGSLGDLVDVFVVEAPPPGDAPPRAGDVSEPLSFALLVRDRDVWHGLAVGTDYDDPRSGSVYFEVAYYAPLELARERGIRRISYGLAASRTKALRGCQLQPVECLLAGVTEPGREAVARISAAWAATPGATPDAAATPDAPVAPATPTRARG